MRYCVAYQNPLESVEIPSGCSSLHPALAIIFEWVEGDESVMGGATSKDLCTRVLNMRIATRLLDGAIIVVHIASEHLEPVSKLEHSIVHEVGRTSLNKKYLLIWEVFGEPAGHDTASSSSSDNDEIEVIGSQLVSRRHVEDFGGQKKNS